MSIELKEKRFCEEMRDEYRKLTERMIKSREKRIYEEMQGEYRNLSDGLKTIQKVLKNVSNEILGMIEKWEDSNIDRYSDLLDVAQNAIKLAQDVQDIVDDIYNEEHEDEE